MSVLEDYIYEQEASRMIGFGEGWLGSQRRNGDELIPYRKLGKRFLYRKEDIEAFINDHPNKDELGDTPTEAQPEPGNDSTVKSLFEYIFQMENFIEQTRIAAEELIKMKKEVR